MKKLIIIFITILFLFFDSNTEATSKYSQKDLYDSFLTTLSPYAFDAITVKSGYKKNFELYDAKIISIERVTKGKDEIEKKINEGMFDFIIKVQYKTFEGPHNPPYGKEIITFRVKPEKILVTNIAHEKERSQ